jgi:hypothetical protein
VRHPEGQPVAAAQVNLDLVLRLTVAPDAPDSRLF